VEQGNELDYTSSHRAASWWVLQAFYTLTLHHVYLTLIFKPRRHGTKLRQVIDLRQGGEVRAGEMLKGSTSQFGTLSFQN
jgi:hypothetical protein